MTLSHPQPIPLYTSAVSSYNRSGRGSLALWRKQPRITFSKQTLPVNSQRTIQNAPTHIVAGSNKPNMALHLQCLDQNSQNSFHDFHFMCNSVKDSKITFVGVLWTAACNRFVDFFVSFSKLNTLLCPFSCQPFKTDR